MENALPHHDSPLTTETEDLASKAHFEVRCRNLNDGMPQQNQTAPNMIATYLRVSTDDQNILAQSGIIDTMIRAQGFDPANVLEFRDEGVSATKMGNLHDRDGGKELIEMIENGEITHVFAFRVDRMFRDPEAGSAFVKWIRTKHPLVEIHTTDAPMSLHTADGEFLYGLQVLLARREAAVLSVRTEGGMDATRQDLKPTSHAVYGWDICHTPDGEKTMRPNWKEQAVLSWIQDRQTAGDSYSKIARQLCDWGVPTKTGSTWKAAGCRRAVVSPAKYQQELHRFTPPNRMSSAPFRALSTTQK